MEKIKNINRYVHYYFLVVISSLLIWGVFEYISICNGQSCTFDMPKLWRGTAFIAVILQLLSIIMIPFIRQYIKDSLKVLKEIYQNINESNFKKPFLIIRLSIAFIAICLIILFIYYVKLHGIAGVEKSIAATQANMFVVAATLFTPIAALIFVQDWKEQHNLKIFSEDARKIWEDLNDERTLWRQHYDTLDSYPENSIALIKCTKFTKLFEESEQEAKNVNRKILKFIRLTNDQKLSNKFNIKIVELIKYQDKYKEQKNLGYSSTNTSFRNIQGIYLSAIAGSIIEIEDYLRDKYILMK
ncbi:hypothetical protein V6C59_20075 [Acinetobacter bereziniae]|uniref:hypothetical protein n=1 Tax=Acinetobacter bereziniae TaxID=106648 RepID=UPI002FDB2D38